MAKLIVWVTASLKIIWENINILEECYEKQEYGLMANQLQALKKHVDSFIELLERTKGE